MPPKISTEPKMILPPRRSPLVRSEVTAAKTGSKAKISAVWAAGVYCWAQFCTEKANPVESSAV